MGTVVAAFLGCFAAMLALAETGGIPNKVVRYLAAFVVGVIAAILLAMLLGWIATAFSHFH